MSLLENTLSYIEEVGKVPSFSTYEERLHPYLEKVMIKQLGAEKLKVAGNSLVYRIPASKPAPAIALAAHLDKINHYGGDYPEQLPFKRTDEYLEGAMDDSAGLGILLGLAEYSKKRKAFPDILFFFSEMEESKGLKEHPHLLKNKGEGYRSGMGARQIAKSCLKQEVIPEEVITIDTTPLFKGEQGTALYSNHWEYTNLEPSGPLLEKTRKTVNRFKEIDSGIRLANNTNDYLHYGYEFNKTEAHHVVSVALEPAIYPYHQKGERVFIGDIERVLNILIAYLKSFSV